MCTAPTGRTQDCTRPPRQTIKSILAMQDHPHRTFWLDVNSGWNFRSSGVFLPHSHPDFILEGAVPNPRSTAKIAGHPLHPMLVPFPIAAFVGALVCDLISTADPFWFRASEYLLAAGVVTALLAAVAGFIDFVGDARIRALTVAWAHFLVNLLIVLVEAFNWYRRYNSGTSDSTGTTLSVVAVVLLLVTGWLGGEMVYRRRVAIADEAL